MRKERSGLLSVEELAASKARDENNLGLIRSYAKALIETGQLIQAAMQVDSFALLDWPQILGYIGESGEWAMEAAGFSEVDAKNAWRNKT